MEVKPITWSYSSLSNFLLCPKQYYETRVQKSVKSPPTQLSLWGDRVHEHFEHRLSSGKPATPMAGDPSLDVYQPVIERFSKTKGAFSAEVKLAIDNAFKPTGWFASDVWCRGIVDALWLDRHVARMVDWKTGRRKTGSYQLRLFALLIFAHHPDVDLVNTAYVWLQTGKVDVEKFRRKDVPKLWQDILIDVRRLEVAYKNNTWVPRPSGICRNHCPVLSCSFNEQGKHLHGEVVK